jgi:hypothetical protein
LDKIHHNLAFREVRHGVENSYGSNNKKKLPYFEKVLFLTIYAAAQLNNWIMDSEGPLVSTDFEIENTGVNLYMSSQ